MVRIDLEADMSDEQQPTPQSPKGAGTLENPFRPNAFEDVITKIAQHARDTGQPAYCIFEGSSFRINSDGSYERSRHMPPLRDNIEEIFESTLERVRDAWNEKSHDFPDGPLSEADIKFALMQPKDSDDNAWKVTIPDGANAYDVQDQLLKLGYVPTRVAKTTVYFGKK